MTSHKTWKSWLGQGLCFGLFIVFIGYFSNSPVYHRGDANQAMIKLSLRHSGKILGECRERSKDEMAKLPENMRISKICPRERSPLLLDMLIDDELIYSKALPPRGLHKDGISSIYFRKSVPSGNIKLKVRMKDHIDMAAFPYQLETPVTLKPGQVLVIDFDSKEKQFTLL